MKTHVKIIDQQGEIFKEFTTNDPEEVVRECDLMWKHGYECQITIVDDEL